VTARAIVVELRQLMIRLGGPVEVRLMTGIAAGRRPGELRGMTGHTRCARMGAGKREGGAGVVVGCRLPGRGGVTEIALMGEPAGLVIRLGCCREVGVVTLIAVGGSPSIAVAMAGHTGSPDVSTGQREDRGMIESARSPVGRGRCMALLTLMRETCLPVVRLLRRLIPLPVTAIAVHRCPAILLPGMTHVAGLAVGDRMGANQRETVRRVHLECTLPALPITRRVASLAVGPQRPAVVIGVAVDAARADVTKHGIFVATRAPSRTVRAGQMKTRGVVVEHQ